MNLIKTLLYPFRIIRFKIDDYHYCTHIMEEWKNHCETIKNTIILEGSNQSPDGNNCRNNTNPCRIS